MARCYSERVMLLGPATKRILRLIPLGEVHSVKTAISYRHVEFPQPVEAAVERHLQKMNTLLKAYAPDLVQLHAAFEKHPHRGDFVFSLNLSLPTGALHATGSGPDARASARKAFVELETQIKKHQARLRKDHEWKRKRGSSEQAFA